MATASAPASRTAAAVSGVIPPIATRGSETAARTARTSVEAPRREGAALGGRREDRADADVVGAGRRGGAGLLDVVGRDARSAAGAQDGARGRDRQVVLAEVDAVRVDGASATSGAVVDEQERAGARVVSAAYGPRRCKQLAAAGVLQPELEESCAAGEERPRARSIAVRPVSSGSTMA